MRKYEVTFILFGQFHHLREAGSDTPVERDEPLVIPITAASEQMAIALAAAVALNTGDFLDSVTVERVDGVVERIDVSEMTAHVEDNFDVTIREGGVKVVTLDSTG